MPRASICGRTRSSASSTTSTVTSTRGAALQLELAAFDARQVEVLVDEAEQVLALARDAGELALLDLGELAEIALLEQLRVGDHRGDRALELVADEAEHLRVGVVGLLELRDAPRLLHGLAESLRDRHLQLDVPRPVRVRAPRAAEDEADHAALHGQRAGEVGAHALLDEAPRGAAARVRLEVQVEVADDARLPGLAAPREETSAAAPPSSPCRWRAARRRRGCSSS